MGNIKIFDTMAKKYDTAERIQIAEIIANEIRQQLVNGKERKAIDFGCGTGLVGLNLLQDFQSLLFLDASQEMVDLIQQKIAVLNTPNADTLCYDFETESSLSLKADVIFMAQVLLHIPDVKGILTNLQKMLNPNGQLLIIDFDENSKVVSDLVHNGFEQKALISLLKEIGFEQVEAHTFYHGKKIFMNEDASLFILNAVNLY